MLTLLASFPQKLVLLLFHLSMTSDFLSVSDILIACLYLCLKIHFCFCRDPGLDIKTHFLWSSGMGWMCFWMGYTHNIFHGLKLLYFSQFFGYLNHCLVSLAQILHLLLQFEGKWQSHILLSLSEGQREAKCHAASYTLSCLFKLTFVTWP